MKEYIYDLLEIAIVVLFAMIGLVLIVNYG